LLVLLACVLLLFAIVAGTATQTAGGNAYGEQYTTKHASYIGNTQVKLSDDTLMCTAKDVFT
jgi:hypothetical protein